MASLDDLLQPQSNELGSTGYTFVDADTLRDAEDNRYRIEGVNAPEVAHYNYEEDRLEQGHLGGAMTTDQVFKLANELGYTNVVKTGRMDDTGSREVIDLQDNAGRSFARQLASSGIAPVSAKHDTRGLQASADYGKFLRTHTDYEDTAWDEASQQIEEFIADNQKYEDAFKTQQLVAGDAQYSGVFNRNTAAFTYKDRETATGKSTNPLSDAWDTGLIGVQEAMWGVTDMLGETTGYDPLKHIGEAGVNRARAKIGDRGSIVLNYKDVNGFGDAMEYVAANSLISLPYMAITLGSAALAPVTGGLSLTAPAAVYAGQTWNEMTGEKNAAVAVGAGIMQAALDRLGLGLIMKSGVAPKALYKEAVEKLTAGGMTREAAEAAVAEATRKELAGYAGDAATVAAAQLTAKARVKDLAVKAAIGTSGEAVTEAMQELTAYGGAVLGSDKTWDWSEVEDRIANAMIAGGTIGGTLSSAGSLYDAGAWADVAVRQAPADQQRLSQAGRYAEQEVAQHGRVKSIQELTNETRGKIAKGLAGPTLEERVDAHKAANRNKTVGESAVDAMLSVPSLWRGATRNIFTPEIQSRSRSARVLADMFGANLQRTFSGSNYESNKFHKVAMYKNMVPIPETTYKIFAGGKRLTGNVKKQISNRIYNSLQAAIDPETKRFNPDLIADQEYRNELVSLANQLNALSDKMWEDQRQFNPDLGYQHNYLMRYKAFDKYNINKNKHQFIQKLVAKTGMSEADAKEITEAILDSSEVNDLEEAFSVTRGGIVPGSHRERTLNLSEDPEFQDFMQQDLFANIATAAKASARYTAHREFVGQNGDVVAQLLNDMQSEGVDSATVNKVAKQLQDYLDAESGNYKRPTSDAGKAAIRLQKNFMMFTTLAGLPLATVSSIVEIALSMKGLTQSQITRKDGGLVSLGKEFAQMLWDGGDAVASAAIRKQDKNISGATRGQKVLQNSGFYEWDVGAATVTGVSETNPWQQQWYEIFFRATGLTGWTNFTRAIRASMAGDFITDKLDTILEAVDNTNEVQEAREALRTIGVNVDDMLNLYQAMRRGPLDPQQMQQLEENMREGTFNFVNEAVALPQAANRPLIYQDPRFALFTQFQGFIATFTANHIPKLWGEYVKRGTPAMKYNAFAVMATMVMLGFASQYLKDLIKYGGRTPHLDNAEYLQRGIRSSGLLGTGERVLDQFFPLYDQKSDDAGEWVLNTTTGESPALSNVKRLAKASGDILTGDVGKGTKNIAKSTPVIGPFNFITEGLGDAASSWNFKGE